MQVSKTISQLHLNPHYTPQTLPVIPVTPNLQSHLLFQACTLISADAPHSSPLASIIIPIMDLSIKLGVSEEIQPMTF